MIRAAGFLVASGGLLMGTGTRCCGDILDLQGTYSGSINAQPLIGSAFGVMDTSGDGLNRVQLDLLDYPSGGHPYAYGVSHVTIICWGGNKGKGGAKNLFELSGGNYTMERSFTWPSLPGSQVFATGAVSTAGGSMSYSTEMNGVYDGPTDLVGVRSYTVVWEQVDASTIHEMGVGEIVRSDGSTLLVNVDSLYGGLSQQMPTSTQYGVMTKRDLTWDGSTYTLEWGGYLVPSPSTLVAASVVGALASRRRR